SMTAQSCFTGSAPNMLRRILIASLFAALAGVLTTPGDAATTHYVDINNPAPQSPYTNWATAAATIQDAIDAATTGDVVVVSNGNYQAGARVVYGSSTNRVVVDKAITLQSVNGAGSTAIIGFAQVGGLPPTGIRCVYLTNGSALIGFTLTNGCTRNTGNPLTE